MREADESLIGRTLAGKYVVLEVLGRGAMGCVYKARQLVLDKIVALKVMHPVLAEDPHFAARFKREAKAASKLDHPASIRVLDYGEEADGLLFIAMEYVQGRSLLGVIHDEWPLSPVRISDILCQVCAALAMAHEMGIIHRDVKPENILVASAVTDDGVPADAVKVCDFGIAKVNDARAYPTGTGSAPLTRTGAIVGTPEYMSPEQGRGDPLDARSDVYSLGVILFQLLTGRVPFEAESAVGVILKHITDPPPDPVSLNPMAHRRLSAVALKAMRKRPDERYASARDLRAELRAAAFGDAPLMAQGAPTPLPHEVSRPQLSGGASTVTAMSSDPRVIARNAEIGAHPTELDEMTAVLPATPIWKIAVGITLFAGLLAGGVVVARSTDPNGVSGPRAHASSAPPTAVLEPTEAPLAPLSFHDGGARNGRPASARPTGSASRPSASGLTATMAAPSGSALPIPLPFALPEPSPVAPALPLSLGPYAMGRAWVEIGAITSERVPERDVRMALRQLELATCYRDALGTKQSHAAGIAIVNLSYEEAGGVAAAVITDAQFLPEMVGCLQQKSARASVRSGTVEPGGGTATAQLVFKNDP